MTLGYIVFGYLSGSVLFANLCGHLFHKDILESSKDRNPGTANAFVYGGLLCGILTLCGDLLKGFLPVYLYSAAGSQPDWGLAFVMAAPVLGHGFSLFYRLRGGKCIAVSFGCLLGLLPNPTPVGILACAFIVFSTVIKITPHSKRTLLAFVVAWLAMALFVKNSAILIGFAMMTGLVGIKLFQDSRANVVCQSEPG